MNKIPALCLCFMLLAGCTSTPTISAPSPVQSAEPNIQPTETFDDTDNTLPEVTADYDWWEQGNSYVRDDGTYTLSMECQTDGFTEWLMIYLTSADGAYSEIGSIIPAEAELTADGLLYHVYDDGTFDLLYSSPDDALTIIDRRNDEPDYSGDYHISPYDYGQPLFPWYEDKYFYNPDTGLYLYVNTSSEYLSFILIINRVSAVYADVKREDVEVFADEERGGYSYRYIYEQPNGPVAFLYNSELDTVDVLDISGAEFNPSGIYYRAQIW